MTTLDDIARAARAVALTPGDPDAIEALVDAITRRGNGHGRTTRRGRWLAHDLARHLPPDELVILDQRWVVELGDGRYSLRDTGNDTWLARHDGPSTLTAARGSIPGRALTLARAVNAITRSLWRGLGALRADDASIGGDERSVSVTVRELSCAVEDLGGELELFATDTITHEFGCARCLWEGEEALRAVVEGLVGRLRG